MTAWIPLHERTAEELRAYQAEMKRAERQRDIEAGLTRCEPCDRDFSSIPSLRRHTALYHPKAGAR